MPGTVRLVGVLAVGLSVAALGVGAAGKGDPKPQHKKTGPQPTAVKPETQPQTDYPSDRARHALERAVNLEFKDVPLKRVLDQLAKKAGVPIMLDTTAFEAPEDSGEQLPPVTYKGSHVRLGAALRAILQPQQLGYAVVAGEVLIASPAVALERQINQPVTLHVEDKPLDQALRQLRGQTGANLVLDRRGEDQGQTKLTVDLDEVPLETAVRLLAAEANLELIRTANVLFVTTSEGAARLRKDLAAPAGAWQCNALGALGVGGGVGGGALMGVQGGGALGLGGGLGGCCGGGGFAGGAGFAGAVGFGGGAFGIGGGQSGGAAPQGSGAPPQPAEPAPKANDKQTSLRLPAVTAFSAPAADAKKPPANAKPAQPKATTDHRGAVERTQELRDKLAQRGTIDFPPGSTLKDALDYLHDVWLGGDFGYFLDSQAFRDDAEFPTQEVDNAPVKLPKLTALALRTALRLLLEPVHGSFVLRDGVLIVTTAHVVESGAVLKQPVDVVIRNETLNTALQELSALSGANIVLDSRYTDEANKPVSADLAGVPVDVAVRLVADMVGLRPVRLQNVLYVTRPDNARKLEADERRRRENEPEAPPGSASRADARTGRIHLASTGKPGQ
jgi:hypothetical protein